VNVVNHGEPRESARGAKLRAAFSQHAAATRRPWTAAVCELSPPLGKTPGRGARILSVELSAQDAETLTEVLIDAAERVERKKSGDLISTPRAARMLGVDQATIRGWIKRKGPKDNPFPDPDLTESRRNFWRKGAIKRWQERQRSLDEDRRQDRQR
jgi:predicted DNA-binding transcriptional regulator AlpA